MFNAGDKIKIISTSCPFNGNCSAHTDNNNTCIGLVAILKKIKINYVEISFNSYTTCSSLKLKDIQLMDFEWNEEENL